MKLTTSTEVDIYPVGVLAELLRLRRAVHQRNPKMIRWALRRLLKGEGGYIVRQARRRDWHAVKCCFNGYLAEPRHWPEGMRRYRCGTGWTKRRALRSLRRNGYRDAA